MISRGELAQPRASIAVAKGHAGTRGRSMEEGKLTGEQRVTDERDRVEDRMRDNERADPADAPVHQHEDHAHHRVADEAAEALVQVVRATEHRTAGHDRPDGPAQLLQSGHQVPDDDHLFEDRVLRGGEDEHRYRPPDVRQRRRYHGHVEPGLPRGDVEPETRDADERGEPGTEQRVEAWAGWPQPEYPRRGLVVAPQQVYRQ